MSENNLKKYVDDFFEGLELYDDYKNGHNYKGLLTAAIDVFLEHENNYTAFEIYQTFFMIYQITPENKSEEKKQKCNLVSEPNTLLDLVNIMKDYEEKTGDLIERQRDHFIHSVNVFLLGLAIYSQNKNYRDVFKSYVEKSEYEKFYKTKDKELSDEEFLYRWGVASLFHDIGYPFEIIGKQLNKFINDGVKSISNTYDVEVSIDFNDFNEFNSIVRLEPYDFADNYRARYDNSKIIDLFKPTEIMAHKIAHNFKFNKNQYNDLLKHLNAFISYMKENNFIDHGFFSAILVLNSYGNLIQKYAKNKDFFFYPIVDSASAILLHNYYNKTLQKDPFSLGPLYVESYPIAFLLILCDELQEWNRQPFGVIDKQKDHVNDLNITIDNSNMDVEYILNSGSMGLGFHKEKKAFIYEVLDIERTVFPKGLSVTIPETDFEQEAMLDMDISDIDAPHLLLRNLEKLARKINLQYNDTKNDEFESGKEDEIDEEIEIEMFNSLRSDLKLSNIRQARSIPKKLDMIGCVIADKSDERPAITEFLKKEVTDLAIFEHMEWMEEKENTGWTLTDGDKDEVNLKTPYLVPWDDLDPKIQQYDIDAVKNIPSLLDSIGLKVVRSRLRLLTFEMHKFYLKETGVKTVEVDGVEKNISDCTPKELFDVLPNHIQYSNYKQADFIVKILKERKYELVDKTDKREKIEVFDEKDLEYFAKREHKNWYNLRVNLGWTYGNGEGKTSPNLVSWDKLGDEIKEENKRTFKNLPIMCDMPLIQLKIVRSE
ncbi:hypothetical protein [Methanobrevibacter millerae]|uniref:Ryanodine receptor Ryr domain-containing protein n=1 Tax=Methanobrevibacter millerae TaxID=230361 RepID=A0A1G5VRQ4_9EURY|nr:hypothetical protein [Methanobrevibacter millerae]SDA48374.1 hypothetical protein SAMN02910315_00808 [Methanobrevibacter millerae]